MCNLSVRIMQPIQFSIFFHESGLDVDAGYTPEITV